MIYTLKDGESFDAEILRQELVAALGPDGWHINTAGNTVEFIGNFDPSEVIAAHFASGAVREIAKTASAYVNAVQQHMDAKARERRYDNIVSACSYAAAPNVFQAESQAYLAWRAACWAHLYQMQAEVQGGQRALPLLDDLIAELPALVLP